MNRQMSAPSFVYVSNAIDGDISVFHLDTASGQITPHARYEADETVMPMALSPDQGVLYAATRGKARHIMAWSIDRSTGDLALRAKAPIESSLAYLSVDPSGEFLVGASYGEHRVSLYRADRIESQDGAPVQVTGDIEHAHAAVVSPDGRFVYVTSLGSNRVLCFEIEHEGEGRLRVVDEVHFDAGFGPRHLRLSPNGDWLYVLSEFRATVAAFRRDDATGRLVVQGTSVRPAALADLHNGRVRPNFADAQLDPATLASLIWAADIHITHDSRFVYLSERTSSRLVAMRVQADGKFEYIGYVDTETQPRGFRIDPSGRFLVACGEQSSHVSVYAIDTHTGALSLVSRCAGGQGANWIEIVAPQNVSPLGHPASAFGRG